MYIVRITIFIIIIRECDGHDCVVSFLISICSRQWHGHRTFFFRRFRDGICAISFVCTAAQMNLFNQFNKWQQRRWWRWRWWLAEKRKERMKWTGGGKTFGKCEWHKMFAIKWREYGLFLALSLSLYSLSLSAPRHPPSSVFFRVFRLRSEVDVFKCTVLVLIVNYLNCCRCCCVRLLLVRPFATIISLLVNLYIGCAVSTRSTLAFSLALTHRQPTPSRWAVLRDAMHSFD